MAIFNDLAQVRLLPESSTQARIRPSLIILHTMGGFLWGTDSHFRHASSNEAHFGVGMDGTIVQWMDTGVRADAAWSANTRAITIETEDKAKRGTQWTPAQLASIAKLLRRLHQVHGIPLRMVNHASESGIGWHAQFHTWNKNRHDCPGDKRVKQLQALVPTLGKPSSPTTPTPQEDTNMPLSKEDLYAVRQEVIKALDDETHHYLQDELQPIKDALARVTKMIEECCAVETPPLTAK